MAKKSRKTKPTSIRSRRAVKLQPAITKVALPVGHVAHVEIPAGHIPVVAVDPVQRVVHVAHAPLKKSWWTKLWE